MPIRTDDTWTVVNPDGTSEDRFYYRCSICNCLWGSEEEAKRCEDKCETRLRDRYEVKR